MRARPKPAEIDPSTWMPVAPRCGRCGDAKRTVRSWTWVISYGVYSCSDCLTGDELKWHKAKEGRSDASDE